jgi:magnesium chelatase family protein
MAGGMLAVAESAVLLGMTSQPVRVEVKAGRGIPAFELVGLAETAVRESRVRVKSSLAALGVDLNEYRVTVNLAPADVRKSGCAFDLAIALGTLVALGQLPQAAIEGILLLGELSLNGFVQPLRGMVAHLLGARRRGVLRAIVPAANEGEACLVDHIHIALAESLSAVVDAFRGNHSLERPKAPTVSAKPSTRLDPGDDLAEVRGQQAARRALEGAAAGGHNLLMMGPAGAGKTMLARRLPGILPPLTREERLEVIAVHGIAGLPTTPTATQGQRPFRAPHHSVSDSALVGGGELARPGEVSLAHCGVLFLDELAEIRRTSLEALRQPLEDGFVSIARMKGSAVFPAAPMLVAATNPCPCGNRGDGTGRCACSPDVVRQYRRRLSGPLLDRIDVHVVLPPVGVSELEDTTRGESSAIVRSRVERARERQLVRFKTGVSSAATNARLRQRDIEAICQVGRESRALLEEAVRKRGLSARGYGKVLRVARTIADLAGEEHIATSHVAEAIAGRVLDRDTGERNVPIPRKQPQGETNAR